MILAVLPECSVLGKIRINLTGVQLFTETPFNWCVIVCHIVRIDTIEFFTIRIFWQNLPDLPNENKSGEIQ